MLDVICCMCGKLWPIVATILPGDQIRLACVHRQGRAWKVVTLIICHILLLLLKCDHFQRINKMCTGSRSWLLFCAPERWQSHCSVYRAAELEHILCTASWSQVAKCVPIHSLNITTNPDGSCCILTRCYRAFRATKDCGVENVRVCQNFTFSRGLYENWKNLNF